MSLLIRNQLNAARAIVVLAALLQSLPLLASPQLGLSHRGPVNLPANFNRLAGPQAVVEMPCEVVNPDPAAVRLSLSDPPFITSDISVADESFTAIRMDGEGSTLDEGAPDLPRVSRLIMISNTGNVDVRIAGQSYHIESLDHRPAPYHRELAGDGTLDGLGGAAPDPRVYDRDAWYPALPVEISPPMVLRDVRFVLLMVYPVQVNPVTGEMRVYDRLDVELNNTGGTGENEIAFQPTEIAPSFKQLYNSFLNFPGSALDALPVVPGKFLYICQNNATVLTQVDRLITWRRKKGEDAYRATTDIIGTTNAQIRSYIQTEYNNSNGKLASVTLVGDPVAGNPYFMGTDDEATYDNYFGALTGGSNPDPLQDVAVGRLPCNSSGSLTTIVNKVVTYESTPFLTDTTWFTRAYCVSHTDWNGSPYIPSNPSTKEYTRQIMLQSTMSQVLVDTFPDYLNVTRYTSRVNLGNCVINHRMSTNIQQTSNDLSGIACGRMNPFICEISCGYGWFTHNNPSEDVTKVWLRMGTGSSPNGAIGAVGMANTNTHVAENNIVDAGMMYGIYALDIHEQGVVLMSGELQLFKQYWGYGREGDVELFTWWANLMGDAATPLWTAVPHAPVVTRADSVRLGDNQFSVNVQLAGQPIRNALVGLLKGAEVFARGYTDASGSINLSISPTTSGFMYVTVTGKDLIPKLDSVRVVQAAQWLGLFSTTVDDDNVGGTSGDANAVLNPGETVDLSIRLRNAGNTQTASGINAVLASTSPGISVISGSSSYPNILPGNNQPPATPFRILVGPVFNGEPVQLYLTVTSSAGTQLVRVDLTPVAADVAFLSSAFPDGNNRPDPGETGAYSVIFTNSGARTLSGAGGILRSLDPRLVVNDSTGSFGTVNAAANGSNSGDPFNISVGGLSYGGLQIPLMLIITDANGFRDSVSFSQTIGLAAATSPTGPDAYGYYAYDNTEIEPGGAACTFDWVEIDPTQGGPGFALNLADAQEDSDQVAVQTLPFNFQFYGQTFNQITICTNGWLAFGAYAIDDFRNYRIGTPLGPPYMVAAYWDDLITRGFDPQGDVYVYSDLSTGRYIVEWVTETLDESAPSSPEVFEVILYNPEAYPSTTGDGKILVQYSNINPVPNHQTNDNDWATVGIQNGNHTIGLEYSWYGTYPPTAASLVNGRAVMYTTDPAGTLFSELTVTSPNGGEILMRDSVATLTWYPASILGSVNIELSRNGPAGPYTTIIPATDNDGLALWTVTGPSTSEASLRVVPISDISQADTSDNNFSIAQIVALISEDFENGAPSWTHTSAGGPWVDDWHISTERALSGVQSYKCGDTGTGNYRVLNDARLVLPIVNSLPANASLQFEYQIETELSGAFPDSAYDGGVVELSSGGGPFNEIFPTTPYPRTLRWEKGGSLPASGPMRGYPCFGGDVLTWSAASFDLSPYAGQNIQLRFRFGSDSVTTREGWYLDNVQVIAPAVIPPPPVVPIQTTLLQTGAILTLRWFDDTNSQYRIYSADTPEGSLTLVGTTSGTSFVVPGGPAAARKFYVVTGWDGVP